MLARFQTIVPRKAYFRHLDSIRKKTTSSISTVKSTNQRYNKRNIKKKSHAHVAEDAVSTVSKSDQTSTNDANEPSFSSGSSMIALLSVSNTASDSSSTFILDSGASNHFCANKSLFSTLKPLKKPKKILLANGHTTLITHSGTIYAKMNGLRLVKLRNVLFMPGGANLLSISKLLDSQIQSAFQKNGLILNDSKDEQNDIDI